MVPGTVPPSAPMNRSPCSGPRSTAQAGPMHVGPGQHRSTASRVMERSTHLGPRDTRIRSARIALPHTLRVLSRSAIPTRTLITNATTTRDALRVRAHIACAATRHITERGRVRRTLPHPTTQTAEKLTARMGTSTPLQTPDFRSEGKQHCASASLARRCAKAPGGERNEWRDHHHRSRKFDG